MIASLRHETAVVLESFNSSISTALEALGSLWHDFTSKYPGLLERCIITIGVAYIISIGWFLVKISAKIGRASVKWSVSKICRTLGLTIFENSDGKEHVIDNELYGLEHMALNWAWEGGLETMWMNMGYWKVVTALKLVVKQYVVCS